MEIKTQNKSGRLHRGMALLLSLSVIMLMSIGLMNAFETKTMEVAQLKNNADKFQADSLTKSGLVIILSLIKQGGGSAFSIIQEYEGSPIPLDPVEGATITILNFSQGDTKYNLNKRINTNNSAKRSAIFFNIVKIIRLNENPDDLMLSNVETEEALSALLDWTDVDDEMDSHYMYNNESYPGEEPPIEVKNSLLDFVSEIKVIPSFRNLGIFNSELYKGFFRADDSTNEYINVNLAKKGEVELFLERFEDVPGYEMFYDHRTLIDELATEESEKSAVDDPFNLVTGGGDKFAIKDFSVVEKSEWWTKLGTHGITPGDFGNDIFKPTSEHVYIQYGIGIEESFVVADVNIGLTYKSNSDKISKMEVLSFTVR